MKFQLLDSFFPVSFYRWLFVVLIYFRLPCTTSSFSSFIERIAWWQQRNPPAWRQWDKIEQQLHLQHQQQHKKNSDSLSSNSKSSNNLRCSDSDVEWVDYIDDYFMQLAIRQAQKAARVGEVPIGAVVVQCKKTQTLNPSVHNTPNNDHFNDNNNNNNNNDSFDSYPQYFRILSCAHNQVEALQDASAHAELLALRAAARRLGNWRLSSSSSSSSSPSLSSDITTSTATTTIITTTLYCTVEPCLACWSALHAFRVNRLVYGAPDLRLGALTVFRQYQGYPYNHYGSSSSSSSLSSSSPPNNNHHVSAVSAAALPPPQQHPFHTLSEVKQQWVPTSRHEECAGLLRDFFRQRRRESKTNKQKKKRVKNKKTSDESHQTRYST